MTLRKKQRGNKAIEPKGENGKIEKKALKEKVRMEQKKKAIFGLILFIPHECFEVG